WPEPELVDRSADYDGDAPSADEVSHRITDAIQSRGSRPSVLAAVAARLAREDGATPALRAEPPVEPAEASPFGAHTPRVVVPPKARPVAPSRQARDEAQPSLRF
ncbi:DNA translocase FtsK, partial [Glutamicibacter soli]|nr:DNA translocase FtsK [Glutamicibacter soli]